MFGKLVKYEFKSVGRWYLAIYAGVIGLSAILGIWIQSLALRSQTDSGLFYSSVPTEGVLFGITTLIYGFLLATLALSTFILIINRFRKSVYGREGYLTMTLPVSNHSLILSKLVVSYVWTILAGLTAGLSIVIIGSMIANVENVDFWFELSQFFNRLDWATLLQYFIQSTIEGIVGILLIFFSLSVGQLFKDHRLLFAILTYVGIAIILFVIQSTVALTSASYATSYIGYSNPFLILFNIVLGFGYYFGTYYIMTKKLNIQ